MNVRAHLLVLCCLISALGLEFTHLYSVQAQGSKTCPTPALERFQRYRASRGDTLESIAQRYNLSPETILAMNPALKNSRVAVGSEILIPPLDGIVVEVPKGNNWQQLAEVYRVRADALFELNGCKAPSRFAFIPTPNKSVSRANTPVSPTSSNSPQVAGYPLPEVAQVGFPYGWQIHPRNGNGQVFFHSGIDLLAAKGTTVSAIAPGTVVFAGEQGTYGNLVIINHDGGLQSRYAQLDSIKAKVGQQVKQGDLLGTVGTTGQPTINQPHLHFEVRSSSSLGWKAKDPKGYLQR
ncbi:M23 family metallopeptidase [Chlorogloeopsis sp. ULAP02]|uniref:LysM peptidoglycan-binding domain-containing M23 family metallopeptidase n=1 Tax=Chlorogloeopsis sp. ULAP02 TaxID=3107926 RepID=UPI0031351246